MPTLWSFMLSEQLGFFNPLLCLLDGGCDLFWVWSGFKCLFSESKVLMFCLLPPRRYEWEWEWAHFHSLSVKGICLYCSSATCPLRVESFAFVPPLFSYLEFMLQVLRLPFLSVMVTPRDLWSNLTSYLTEELYLTVQSLLKLKKPLLV